MSRSDKEKEGLILDAPLIIDTREPDALIKTIRKRGFFKQIVVREMEVGDFKIGNLVIERKTYSDFLNSWHQGRLESQVERLARLENDVGILIVYSSTSDRYVDKKMWVPLRKHLNNLNFVIPIFKTKNEETFIDMLENLAKHALDGEYLFEFSGRKTRIHSAPNETIYFYSGLPGVSIKLAERIYKKFPAPIDLIHHIQLDRKSAKRKKSKRKKWYENIEGIGAGKAEAIENFLLGE